MCIGCDKASGPATASPCTSRVARATVGVEVAALAAAHAARLKATTNVFNRKLRIWNLLDKKECNQAVVTASSDDEARSGRMPHGVFQGARRANGDPKKSANARPSRIDTSSAPFPECDEVISGESPAHVATHHIRRARNIRTSMVAEDVRLLSRRRT